MLNKKVLQRKFGSERLENNGNAETYIMSGFTVVLFLTCPDN
jgi:hypothetical protein